MSLIADSSSMPPLSLVMPLRNTTGGTGRLNPRRFGDSLRCAARRSSRKAKDFSCSRNWSASRFAVIRPNTRLSRPSNPSPPSTAKNDELANHRYRVPNPSRVRMGSQNRRVSNPAISSSAARSAPAPTSRTASGTLSAKPCAKPPSRAAAITPIVDHQTGALFGRRVEDNDAAAAFHSSAGLVSFSRARSMARSSDLTRSERGNRSGPNSGRADRQAPDSDIVSSRVSSASSASVSRTGLICGMRASAAACSSASTYAPASARGSAASRTTTGNGRPLSRQGLTVVSEPKRARSWRPSSVFNTYPSADSMPGVAPILQPFLMRRSERSVCGGTTSCHVIDHISLLRRADTEPPARAGWSSHGPRATANRRPTACGRIPGSRIIRRSTPIPSGACGPGRCEYRPAKNGIGDAIGIPNHSCPARKLGRGPELRVSLRSGC